MPAIKKARRSRSQFANMDDVSRQLVYDQAKSRMQQAHAQAEKQVQRERAAAEQQKATAHIETTRRIERDTPTVQHQQQLEKMPKRGPGGPQVPLAVRRNQNSGNPRRGMMFRTRQVAGGVQHVYNDGTRVFVRKSSPAKKTGGTVAPGAQAIAKQRTKVAGQVVQSNVPKPGQGAGVIRRLSRKPSRRRV